MPVFYIKVQRSTEDGVEIYHVAEAYPAGQIDQVTVYRGMTGYSAKITRQKSAPPVTVGIIPTWGQFISDLKTHLHEELQCPYFDQESEIREPPIIWGVASGTCSANDRGAVAQPNGY